MNIEIINEISKELNITIKSIEITLKLLQEGNTIPFIARYRKEMTGNLNEEEIRKINEVYLYQVNLLERKNDVIRLIDEKGLLTEDLKNNILSSTKLIEVEDLYRPFKEKKKTKASDAIANNLKPLADSILEFKNINIKDIAKNYLNDNVLTVDDAITGAGYIIAEMISDNANYRKWIRSYLFNNALITSKKKKDSEDVKELYKNYYDFKENVRNIKSYRLLAINRGEKEKIITVNYLYNDDIIIEYLKKAIIKNENCESADIVYNSIKDSLTRLILPSVLREIRGEINDIASDVAIDNFSKNLEALLMISPLKEKTVLALDPAYRTGCKLAVLDKTGLPLDISVIYPTPPHNEILQSEKIVLDLINKYHVDIIAIGNGTASRESEQFISNVIKKCSFKVEYVMVNEAGASVYSASELAIKEFPDLTVEKRSAISIGRRLQDSLAELVKIDPKSIGVGLYQHDVKQSKLEDSLDFTVLKAVNQVGVNINTASASLLKYVSGLNTKAINEIINYRNKNHKINSREEVKKIKGITPKIYEQSIGFLRIVDGINPLDKTSIHPDNYNDTYKLLKKFNLDINNLGTNEFINTLNSINKDELQKELDIDKYTLEDIIESLKKPNRDPRDNISKPILKSDVLTINDVKIGMKLEGVVRNVVDFGLFIDVGLHNDGLAHISKLSKDFIKHPSELFKVGDILTCYIIDIDKKNEKISLSLFENIA